MPAAVTAACIPKKYQLEMHYHHYSSIHIVFVVIAFSRRHKKKKQAACVCFFVLLASFFSTHMNDLRTRLDVENRKIRYIIGKANRGKQFVNTYIERRREKNLLSTRSVCLPVCSSSKLTVVFHGTTLAYVRTYVHVRSTSIRVSTFVRRCAQSPKGRKTTQKATKRQKKKKKTSGFFVYKQPVVPRLCIDIALYGTHSCTYTVD